MKLFLFYFSFFNCLWTCSCFHQPGIQRRLEVKLLQEHWFDSSFLPTTYLKTKGCQSPLFKTVTSKGREEGGRDLSCLCLFSIVNWQLNDSISGVGAHPYLAYPPLSWASESESYLNTPSFFTVLLSFSFLRLTKTYRSRVLYTRELLMRKRWPFYPRRRLKWLSPVWSDSTSIRGILNTHFPKSLVSHVSSLFPFS